MTTATHAAYAATDTGNVAAHRLPLAVLAAEVNGQMMCVVIDSFFDESLAPGLVSVRIPVDNRAWPTLRTAPALGISVFKPGQTGTVAGPSRDRLEGALYRDRLDQALYRDRLGAGVVRGAAVTLTTRVYQEFDAGSHTVALLHVTARTTNEIPEAQRGDLYLVA